MRGEETLADLSRIRINPGEAEPVALPVYAKGFEINRAGLEPRTLFPTPGRAPRKLFRNPKDDAILARMASHVLLVSNPPHPKIDVQTAAAVLGLLPVDANLKVRYGVPEIWLAEKSDEKIVGAHKVLADAGMRTVVVTSDDLLGIAPPRLVRNLEFTYDSIFFGDVEVRNSDAPVIVTASPRAADGAPPNLRSEILPGIAVYDTTPFFHLYQPSGVRLAVYGELLDFSSLGPQKTASMHRNMVVLDHILKARLTRSKFDDRMQNMQLRRRAGHGVPVNFRESRKGYSYASPGLDELLTEISPDLANILQTELCSRLAYLTHSVVTKVAAGDNHP